MAGYAFHKEQVVAAAIDLAGRGILAGTGGNVSVRIEGDDRIAITPSSRNYFKLTAEDVCIVNFDNMAIEGTSEPSVETGMHLAVYRKRPDVNAIIHTHQPYASIFSLTKEPIPSLFDEQAVNLGNCVEVVPYGLSSSLELLNHIDKAVENKCNAFVLQNHGALLLGTNLEKAVTNVLLLEKSAQVYYFALSTGKPVSVLPEAMTDLLFTLLQHEQMKEVERKKALQAS